MAQNSTNPGFAVLDFETNGFGPWEDILEIGVVLLDSNLLIESEFTTLINSHKRVKNSWAHGIDNPQLSGAPTEEVAFSYLLHLLGGRYVVAHNAGFEKRFLDYHAELFQLSGSDTQNAKLIDTMPIAQELCGKRKLTDISTALKITHNAHAALSDAMVSAIILQQAAAKKSKQFTKQLAAAVIWPDRFRAAEVLPSLYRSNDDALFANRSDWLTRANFAVEPANDQSRATYDALISFASLNFHLSDDEKSTLLEAIAELKLTRAEVLKAHVRALQAASAIKFPSKFLNQRGYLLTSLRQTLGLPKEHSDYGLNGASESLIRSTHKIMLSGRLSVEQEALSKILRRRGLSIVQDPAEADIVVVGHVDSTNKRIEEARRLKVVILTEQTFTIFLG